MEGRGHTVAELVDAHERRLFTGRDEQLAWFSSWLDGPAEQVLVHVTGRGGVGKTALLQAFRRLAQERDRDVRYVDARSIAPTPRALLDALGAAGLDELVEGTARGRSVLLFDTFEVAVGLGRFVVHELLPRLDVGCRVVLATRHRLAAQLAWEQLPGGLVHRVDLAGFTEQESDRYLRRRGVHDGATITRIVDACAGNPLAVSLAADLAGGAAPDLTTSSDWRHALTSLSQRLLRDIADPQVRDLLEAAVVLRRFDHDLLAACAGRSADEGAFAELCQLAVVRPANRGWKVHDDVRGIVRTDLETRRPGRLQEHRTRALAHLQHRMERAEGRERRHLAIERLFLYEDSAIRTVLFENEDETVSGEPATPGDTAEILRLWDRTSGAVLDLAGGSAAVDLDRDTLVRLLEHPASTTVVARRADGSILACGPSAAERPGWTEVLPDITARFVAEHAVEGEVPRPRMWFGPMFGEPDDLPAGYAVLIQRMLGAWLRGGTFVVVTRRRGFETELAAALKSETLEVTMPDGERVEGYRLCLPAAEVDAWMRDVLEDVERVRDDAFARTPATSLTTDRAAGVPVVTRVELFGGTRLLTAGGPPVELPRGRPGTAIECVAAADGRLGLDELVEVLWPDTAIDVGRRRLPNILTRVRDRCGPLLVREAAAVTLHPEVTTDLAQFHVTTEEAIRAARAEAEAVETVERLAREALGRATGELLPEHRYADWAAASRERVRRRLVELFDVLVDRRAAVEDTDGAIAMLERAVELDPYDDRRYVRAARLLLGDGNHTAAARWCERAEAVLDELGLAPPPPLQQVRALLARERAEGSSASASGGAW